jgi:hypothetical protein
MHELEELAAHIAVASMDGVGDEIDKLHGEVIGNEPPVKAEQGDNRQQTAGSKQRRVA